MRQFVIDELSLLERDNLESYLKRTLAPGPLAGIFWIALPDDLLAEAQRGHEQCGQDRLNGPLAESVPTLLSRPAGLLMVNQVGACEDGAAGRHTRRLLDLRYPRKTGRLGIRRAGENGSR